MKKLISFVLVVVLMLSVTTQAFAATIDDFVETTAGEVGTTYEMDSNRDYYVWEEMKYGQWFNNQRNWLERLWNSSYYLHEAPWCAIFVSWCSDQVGLGIPRYANVTDMKNWYISEGRYHDWQSYNPKEGDTVFFARNGADSHVGIIESVENLPDVPYAKGKWIKMTVIEGDCIYWEDGVKSCKVDKVSREVRSSQLWSHFIYSGRNVVIGFGEN